ncbi:MAG: DUF4390 domain-containing protein [Gammaproteobacteria bacterium]
MICTLFLLLGYAVPVLAQDGNFVVVNAHSYPDSNHEKILVDAHVNYGLSEEAIAALHSGVMLTFELEVEVTRVRRWWPDKEIARVKRKYELEYDALGKVYVLRGFYDRKQHTYASLYNALNDLGNVEGLPLIASEALDSDRSYLVRLRVSLAADKLPFPLQTLAFWRDDFSLKSEWYRWPLSD